MNVPETFFTIHEELILFFLSCAAGIVLGILYDIFRVLRILIPHHNFFVILEDIIYLSFYGIFLSAFASAQARGELRIYFIIGNILGFALYYFTLGSIVVRIFKKLLSPFKHLYDLFRKKLQKQ